MRLKMDLHGLDDALAKISRFDVATHERVRKQVDKSAKNVQKKAKARVAFRTGKLKNSIKIWRSADGLYAAIYSNSPNSHLVEFGTQERVIKKTGRSAGKMPAMPFMVPSWEEERPKYIEGMKQAVRGAIP